MKAEAVAPKTEQPKKKGSRYCDLAGHGRPLVETARTLVGEWKQTYRRIDVWAYRRRTGVTNAVACPKPGKPFAQ
jgi:hypothetical protein